MRFPIWAAVAQEFRARYRRCPGLPLWRQELQTKMEHNLRRLNDFQANMERDAYNLDYLQQYKQGQIGALHFPRAAQGRGQEWF